MIASERNFSGTGEDGDGGHMVVVGAFLGHKKAILCVRIVGELVCSGSADKTVRLWRRSAGKSYSCVGVLEGHGGPVKCLAVAVESSGDGDGREYMVYSGGLDGDVKVWKVPLLGVAKWVKFVISVVDHLFPETILQTTQNPWREVGTT
ncbi:hypothetical protein E3N88_46037 [Mikania micrantha]|uniref:Uncharacterized protein n=1 Tax=Mikania micrantha TaxID=192012 RepID=A0A5N6L7C9_9ASTR|nr:hypothetical protein E3N88_46037 [Mikania micrantha]